MAFDLKSILVGPASKLITSVRQTFDTATHFLEVLKETVDDAVSIYEQVKDFELQPHWKIRALSVPEAIENIKELGQAPTKIFIAVRDLWQRVKGSIDNFKSPLAEAEAAVEEAGALEGGILRIFPRLATLIGKAATRVVAVAGVIFQIATDVDNAIADIHTIVQQARSIIEKLNHLDVVFMKQTNPRRTVTLADGSTMKIRVGHLHR
jgi:hypothetical protein